jgi:hypothetical protein
MCVGNFPWGVDSGLGAHVKSEALSESSCQGVKRLRSRHYPSPAHVTGRRAAKKQPRCTAAHCEQPDGSPHPGRRGAPLLSPPKPPPARHPRPPRPRPAPHHRPSAAASASLAATGCRPSGPRPVTASPSARVVAGDGPRGRRFPPADADRIRPPKGGLFDGLTEPRHFQGGATSPPPPATPPAPAPPPPPASPPSPPSP